MQREREPGDEAAGEPPLQHVHRANAFDNDDAVRLMDLPNETRLKVALGLGRIQDLISLCKINVEFRNWCEASDLIERWYRAHWRELTTRMIAALSVRGVTVGHPGATWGNFTGFIHFSIVRDAGPPLYDYKLVLLVRGAYTEQDRPSIEVLSTLLDTDYEVVDGLYFNMSVALVDWDPGHLSRPTSRDRVVATNTQHDLLTKLFYGMLRHGFSWVSRSPDETIALLRGVACDACGDALSEGTRPNVCKRCGGARYCGVECQRSDWYAGHGVKCASSPIGDEEEEEEDIEFDPIGLRLVDYGRFQYEAVRAAIRARGTVARDFQQLMSEHVMLTVDLFEAKRLTLDVDVASKDLKDNLERWSQRLGPALGAKWATIFQEHNTAVAALFDTQLRGLPDPNGVEKYTKILLANATKVAKFWTPLLLSAAGESQSSSRIISLGWKMHLDCTLKYSGAGAKFDRVVFYAEASRCMIAGRKLGRELDRNVTTVVHPYFWPVYYRHGHHGYHGHGHYYRYPHHHHAGMDHYSHGGRMYNYHGVKCQCEKCRATRYALGVKNPNSSGDGNEDISREEGK